MKKITKLKLSNLNKNSIVERQLALLMGGNYCYWGDANQAANEAEGVCSCICYGSECYYTDSTYGIQNAAGYLKDRV